MKKILISIKPKWVKKILNGEKTLEIRKTAPKCELPCEVYIYCTKENTKYFIDNKIYNAMMKGKVVAKFTLNKVEKIKKHNDIRTSYFTDSVLDYDLLNNSWLPKKDIENYLNGKTGYAWHIDNLVPFDRPKELKEFEKQGSYLNPSVKCPKKDKGKCNEGISPFTGKWCGCEKARLTHAPQSWCYCEVDE